MVPAGDVVTGVGTMQIVNLPGRGVLIGVENGLFRDGFVWRRVVPIGDTAMASP